MPIRLLLILLPVLAMPAIAQAQAPAPALDEVREAALRHARLDRRLDRWSGRARWSNALPRLRATVGWYDHRELDTTEREYLSRDADGMLLHESTQSTIAEDARFRSYYSVHATLDLGRIIFDPYEVQAAREERARLRLRQSLVEEVTALYFQRRRVASELRVADTPGARAGLRLELDELTGRLDGLTGGWFSREIARRSARARQKAGGAR